MQDRDPETYRDIRDLKTWIKEHSELQRVAKVARRTKRGSDEERAAARKVLGLQGSYPEAAAQAFHASNRFWLTGAHILYGQLREGKQHVVSHPAEYKYAVTNFLRDKLGRELAQAS